VIVENLAARSAGTRVSHGPEIRTFAQAGAARGIDSNLLRPDSCGFLVLSEDRDPKPVLGDPQRPGHEVPGVVDRLALEIVAEAEVAQHLEKRVMPRRVADVFEIVVLAARAHAALRACRPRVVARFLAEKNILELNHAGIGEQQRGIIAGYQ
jgi:hypothetical protein